MTGTGRWDDRNVIAVSFEDGRTAARALRVLEALDREERVYVRDAVVVGRREDGTVVVKERLESPPLPATAGGGLIGLLIGAIGGPLGAVIGGISGLVIGSLVDVSDVEDADSALTAISRSVKVGQTALLAVVDEQRPDVVDVAMAELGGTVVRRPVADVEAEVAAPNAGAEEEDRRRGPAARR